MGNIHLQAYVEVEIAFDSDEQSDIPEVLRILGREEPPPLPERPTGSALGIPTRLSEGWPSASMVVCRCRTRASVCSIVALSNGMGHPGMESAHAGNALQIIQRIGGLRFFPQDRNLRQHMYGVEQGSSSSSAYSGDEDDGSEDAAKVRLALVGAI